jgi:hypothetical protein
MQFQKDFLLLNFILAFQFAFSMSSSSQASIFSITAPDHPTMRISAWIVCVLTWLASLEARPDPGPDADHSGTGIDFSKAVDDPETGLQVHFDLFKA